MRVHRLGGWGPAGVFEERRDAPWPETWEASEQDMAVGTYLYLLRLNAHTRRRVEAALRAALPPDFDPARTIAMPIRASVSE